MISVVVLVCLGGGGGLFNIINVVNSNQIDVRLINSKLRFKRISSPRNKISSQNCDFLTLFKIG